MRGIGGSCVVALESAGAVRVSALIGVKVCGMSLECVAQRRQLLAAHRHLALLRFFNHAKGLCKRTRISPGYHLYVCHGVACHRPRALKAVMAAHRRP